MPTSRLLVLGGPLVPKGELSSYRGTYRMPPTYCNQYPLDHMINRAFAHFAARAGNTGFLDNYDEAIKLLRLYKESHPPQYFDVIEVTFDLENATLPGSFLGYDVTLEGGFSLLSWGLNLTAGKSDADLRLPKMVSLFERYFLTRLNDSGLFADRDIALFFLKCAAELQSFIPVLFSSGCRPVDPQHQTRL